MHKGFASHLALLLLHKTAWVVFLVAPWRCYINDGVGLHWRSTTSINELLCLKKEDILKDKMLTFLITNLCRDSPDEITTNQCIQKSASFAFLILSLFLKIAFSGPSPEGVVFN